MKVKKSTTQEHQSVLGKLAFRLQVIDDEYVRNLKVIIRGGLGYGGNGDEEITTLNEKDLGELIDVLTEYLNLMGSYKPFTDKRTASKKAPKSDSEDSKRWVKGIAG